MIEDVNSAFNYFMANVIDLNKDTVFKARNSRDNLLENISEFNNYNFFHLWQDINIQFGSFARKTKKRPLDDIDLMIGISADGATYNSGGPWFDIYINASPTNTIQQSCTNSDGTLNSTMVLNRFKSRLETLRDYKHSEIHKNGEAITLNLTSREWSFDIVPCFQTVDELNGRNYYLIPNGKGTWKKTDPRRDRNYVKRVNEANNNKLLPLVRLCKKWFEVKNFSTPASYLIETLVVRYCEQAGKLNDYIDLRFRYFLDYLKKAIHDDVQDLKDIQGNINNIKFSDQLIIAEKAQTDYEKAIMAFDAEIKEKNQQKAINLWRDILGGDFPTYGQYI